jgi:hypothetical protein
MDLAAYRIFSKGTLFTLSPYIEFAKTGLPEGYL